MRAGDLPFWLKEDGKFVRRAQVRLADILPFLSVNFDEADWPDFPFKQTYTQVDAAEILNLDALQIRRLIRARDLIFEPDGVALITDRTTVLHLASLHIATAEIGLRTGTKFTSVRQLLSRHPGIARTEAGWDRAAFDAAFGPPAEMI